ncbi:MAG TPA: FMN-binding negative transcriptional regulator [Cellvibrio sp.]|nr:FMN-binding negative transcriptional regulator [Cellvibrio sp.]
MYVPKSNEENNLPTLHALIRARPLGTWAAIAEGEIEVNHIPFVIKEERGEFGALVCHVAKANPIWKTFSQTNNSVITFHGDQAYISPSWYPSKHENGKAVPTWNYCVVHAYGVPQLIHDPQALLAHLNELTDFHESGQALPWKVSDAPADFMERLYGAIVGIEIPIKKIVGKWKLGQSRSEADKLGTIAGLKSGGSAQQHGLANELLKTLTL